jgi:hypothetical protein
MVRRFIRTPPHKGVALTILLGLCALVALAGSRFAGFLLVIILSTPGGWITLCGVLVALGLSVSLVAMGRSR